MKWEEEKEKWTGSLGPALFLGQGAQIRLSSPVFVSIPNSNPEHLQSLRRVQKTVVILNSIQPMKP